MMATVDTRREAPFTYIWTIENISEMTAMNFKSPFFAAHTISESEWQLHVKDESDLYCSLELEDDPLADAAEEEEAYSIVDVEFSFLAADGSTLISQTKDKTTCFMLTRGELLERWGEFVPNNTLTVQCRLWKSGCEITTTDLCCARTRLNTYSESFLWPIEKFSALKIISTRSFFEIPLDERQIYHLKPLTPKGPFLTLIMYLKRDSENEDLDKIYFDLLVDKHLNYAFSHEILVLDANGLVNDLIWDRKRKYALWKPFICSLTTRNELIENRDLLLPNDTLLLKCSVEVCTGFITSEIEYCTPNVSPVVKEEYFDFFWEGLKEEEAPLELQQFFMKEVDKKDLVHNCLEEKKYSDSCRELCPLKTALMYLHRETNLADASLRIAKKLYPVHKNILGSRSPVFNTIFGMAMKENVIEINDMEEHTLIHLLQYIYTDTIKDLRFENVLDLYKATVDYQLMDLKNKCSDFLTMNLCEENVREIQCLANKYQDEKLEIAARDFML